MKYGSKCLFIFFQILMNVRQRLHLVDQELFVKTLLDRLDANVQLEPLETQPKAAKEPLPKNAAQTPNAELVSFTLFTMTFFQTDLS